MSLIYGITAHSRGNAALPSRFSFWLKLQYFYDLLLPCENCYHILRCCERVEMYSVLKDFFLKSKHEDFQHLLCNNFYWMRSQEWIEVVHIWIQIIIIGLTYPGVQFSMVPSLMTFVKETEVFDKNAKNRFMMPSKPRRAWILRNPLHLPLSSALHLESGTANFILVDGLLCFEGTFLKET